MVRIDFVAILQVQSVDNKLDVPTDADDQPCDVSYLFPFTIRYWIIKFPVTIVMLTLSQHLSILWNIKHVIIFLIR